VRREAVSLFVFGRYGRLVFFWFYEVDLHALADHVQTVTVGGEPLFKEFLRVFHMSLYALDGLPIIKDSPRFPLAELRMITLV
jgi:hypothetical protein